MVRISPKLGGIKRRVLIMMIMVMAMTGTTLGCGQNEPLTVGLEEGFRPFAFKEGDEMKGFEVDLWEAVAKEAGLRYKFKPMAAGDILTSVRDKKIDAGLAGITMTKERRKTMDFSTPYFTGGIRILTRTSQRSIQGPKDLKDKIVGTRTGTTSYRYTSFVDGVREVRAYPDIDEAYQALVRGEVDAVVFDGPSLEHYMKSDGKGKVRVTARPLTKEQYGIALPKGSRHLGRVNNALRELGKNGTYERIYMKWFQEKPRTVPGGK